MLSVNAVRLAAIQEGPDTQEEPDTSLETVVVAAIRVHERVEVNLRRLAVGVVQPPRREVVASAIGTDLVLYRNW